MSGLRRDWLAGTSLEKPERSEQSRPRPDAQQTTDVHEQIAILAEHLEREVNARKALQTEMARSFAILESETDARVAAEREARLDLGALHCRVALQPARQLPDMLAAWCRLPAQNTS